MARKTTLSSFGALGSLVFSTDRTMDLSCEAPEEEPAPEPEKQHLIVRKDASGRRGKVVTLVEGFRGPGQALDELAVRLKKHCGTGGSVKDGRALIQGDVRQKAADYLSALGYKVRMG